MTEAVKLLADPVLRRPEEGAISLVAVGVDAAALVTFRQQGVEFFHVLPGAVTDEVS